MTVGNLSRATVRTIVAASVLLAPAVPAAQSQRRPVAQAATPQAQAAPETIKLTIDDAVRRAIEQNPDLAVVKLGTDVEAEHVSEAQSAYRPVFVSSFGRSNVAVPSANPLTGAEAFETSDETERAERLAAHARQVREHATKLAAKAYWRQFAPTPDFVVMFVPDETLLRVAHEHDRRLAEDAWAQGVVLASPSTLMTLLRTVAAVWQQETVARSAQAVHELGTELHKRLGTFAGHLAKVGRSLDGAVGAYNEAVGSFESRVLVQARRLEDHGIAGEIGSPAQIERQARSLDAQEPDAAAVVELPRDAHAA